MSNARKRQTDHQAILAALRVTGRFAIVPLAIAALLTGVVSSQSTVWGLVRHYWVLIKLLITALATALSVYEPRA